MTSSGLEVKRMDKQDLLTIGEVSTRSGLAPSALRYYESVGLIASTRTGGDRRRYRRAVLRRVAVIRAPQQVGLSLEQVRTAFAAFPLDVAPSKKDWTRISGAWQPLLDQRIADLQQVRDNLNSCVGCGCLSMTQCRLYNPQDALSNTGSGARRLFPGAQKTDRAESGGSRHWPAGHKHERGMRLVGHAFVHRPVTRLRKHPQLHAAYSARSRSGWGLVSGMFDGSAGYARRVLPLFVLRAAALP